MRTQTPLVLLLALPLHATPPPEFIPDAAIGRFVDAKGSAIDIQRVGKGVDATLDGTSMEEAHWWGKTFVAGKTVYAVVSDKGRLALASKEAPDRPYVHEIRSPWWKLLPATRDEFTPRFTGIILSTLSTPENFEDWFTKTYGGTPVSRERARAEFVFDRLDRDHRESLLALSAKMRADDGVWDFVGMITYIGKSGEINFYPAGGELAKMRRALEKLGYSKAYLASGANKWGVRSAKSGVQLHFTGVQEGAGNGETHVHVDFYNPTDLLEGGVHIYEDLNKWAETHTTENVLLKIRGQGVDVESSPD